MKSTTTTAGNKIFDHIAARAEDRADLAEQLVCAAALEFHRARDVVSHLHTFDARAFGRNDVGAARAMVDDAIEALARRASDYRSSAVDDLGHLRLQAERAAATPRLEVARYLLGMAE